MKCPACNNSETKVLDSREASDGLATRRRRECLKCNFRFSTYEEIEILDLTVIKRDGRRETYDSEKMETGLRRALQKRKIEPDKFKELVNNIESEIQVSAKKDSGREISSEKIGNIVLKRLKKIDKVAYVRFASVYQIFEDIEDFQEVLQKMIKK